MTAPGSPTIPPSAASHLCVPDPYLNEARLASIFDDFNAEVTRSTSSSTIFTHLVNHVRAPYISHILEQHHQSAGDRFQQPDLQLASVHEHHIAELAVQRAEREARYERKLCELGEIHTRQLAKARTEREEVPRKWLCDIQVVYNAEASHDCLTELYGQSNNVNYAFRGRYVGLVPKYEVGSGSAIDAIQLESGKRLDDRNDLYRGLNGWHRYLLPQYNDISRKIFTANLLRLPQAMKVLPEGWHGCTENINAGRGGDFLYIIWKTAAI